MFLWISAASNYLMGSLHQPFWTALQHVPLTPVNVPSSQVTSCHGLSSLLSQKGLCRNLAESSELPSQPTPPVISN